MLVKQTTSRTTRDSCYHRSIIQGAARTLIHLSHWASLCPFNKVSVNSSRWHWAVSSPHHKGGNNESMHPMLENMHQMHGFKMTLGYAAAPHMHRVTCTVLGNSYSNKAQNSETISGLSATVGTVRPIIWAFVPKARSEVSDGIEAAPSSPYSLVLGRSCVGAWLCDWHLQGECFIVVPGEQH